jgi:hypothetical protein
VYVLWRKSDTESLSTEAVLLLRIWHGSVD